MSERVNYIIPIRANRATRGKSMADNPAPLVMIEWDDSSQPQGRWVHLDELPEGKVIKCVSVGWLVGDGGGVKTLAPNMGDVDSATNMQASGLINIPAAAVTRLVQLIEAG